MLHMLPSKHQQINYLHICLMHTGGESAAGLATCLTQHSTKAAQQSRSLVYDAALALHAATAQQVQGSYCLADRDAESACHMLSGLHSALQACGADDAVLRGATALRLALLLEEKGELESAREVLQQVWCRRC